MTGFPLTCPVCHAKVRNAYPTRDWSGVSLAVYECGSEWCHIDGLRYTSSTCALVDAVGELASVLRRHARWRGARAVRDALTRAERILEVRR